MDALLPSGLLGMALFVGTWLQAAGGPARVKLPPLQRLELPNGLRVIVVEQHELPTVAVNLTVRSGSGANPMDRAGLAGLTADMILLGTRTRSSDQIAEQVDSLGATLASSSTWDSSSITSTALSTDAATIIELVADLVRHPSFPEGELGQLKQRRLNELKTKLDNPSAVANDKFAEVLFPDHPYGLPPDGTIASVQATTQADLLAFHAGNYSAGNAILIVVGDVNPGRILETVRQRFGGWEKGKALSRSLPVATPPRGIRSVLVDRPDLTQTQIRIGHLGVARSTPDWFPLQVANYILGGGGFSSRLLERIRVQKGYTYGLNSSFSARFFPGPFTISTFTPHKTVPEVITESLQVEREFRERGPDAGELEAAKNFFVSGYPRNFETPSGIAAALIEVELYGLGERYIETYQDRMASVSADQVRRAATKYFDPKNMVIVAVTRAADVKERLEKQLNEMASGAGSPAPRLEVVPFLNP